MEIHVELIEQDYKDFYKDYGYKRKNWIGKAILLFLIDISLCFILQVSNSALLLMVLILGGILFFFFFYLPYLTARAKFKRADRYYNLESKKIYKPFAIGVEVIDEDESFFLRYETIKKTGKAGNYIYLILSNDDYSILPKWCFSTVGEVDHFLRLVRSGIANAKGGTPREPFTFKPVYLIGIICLIPLIGAFAGIVLIILGLAHYKDRVFVIMGSIGIAITVAIYGSLIYFSTYSMSHDGAVQDGFAEIAQSQINDLVKNIEFYKLQNGVYPDSLKRLETKDSFLSIDDPLQSIKNNGKSTEYQYYKKGNKYLLFSVGKDGIPDTKDDIYPTLSNPDTSKLGFIRKK